MIKVFFLAKVEFTKQRPKYSAFYRLIMMFAERFGFINSKIDKMTQYFVEYDTGLVIIDIILHC